MVVLVAYLVQDPTRFPLKEDTQRFSMVDDVTLPILGLWRLSSMELPPTDGLREIIGFQLSTLWRRAEISTAPCLRPSISDNATAPQSLAKTAPL
jgi:hypothetical protein